MTSRIFTLALTLLMVQRHGAERVRYGSTRGCGFSCQKECIEVINKYRLNHGATKLKFSQFLADKAQKWADGGRFGYDMKSRGKYGQLVEWDVKDELQSFTSVIKHWHDKGKDFDFPSGRSKTGKTLHDFTQVVWKKVKKAGCGESVMFGSKYYVVWMDADGVMSPTVEDGMRNIGSPKKEDIHWFEPKKGSTKKGPTVNTPERPPDEHASVRAMVEPEETSSRARSAENKPVNAADLNEVQEEQKVLNSNAMLKQYLYNDSLNNIVMDENRDTASFHVVPSGADNANWQKAAESLVQLGNNKSVSENVPDSGVASFPVREADDMKQAAVFQSLEKQQDELIGREGDNITASSDGGSNDELEDGEENQQAAEIQSMIKQEDDMIQNQGGSEKDEEESSGDTEAQSTNSTNNVNDFANSSTQSSMEANLTSSVVNNSTSQPGNGSIGSQLTQVSHLLSSRLDKLINDSQVNGNDDIHAASQDGNSTSLHPSDKGNRKPTWFFSSGVALNNTASQIGNSSSINLSDKGSRKPTWFFSNGVALNNNPNDSQIPSDEKTAQDASEQTSVPLSHEIVNQSSMILHETSAKFPPVAILPEGKNGGSMLGAPLSVQNNKNGAGLVASALQPIMPPQVNKVVDDKLIGGGQAKLQQNEGMSQTVNEITNLQQLGGTPQSANGMKHLQQNEGMTQTTNGITNLQQMEGTYQATNGVANARLGAVNEKEKGGRLNALTSLTPQAAMVSSKQQNGNMPSAGGFVPHGLSDMNYNAHQNKIATSINPQLQQGGFHGPGIIANQKFKGPSLAASFQVAKDTPHQLPGSLAINRNPLTETSGHLQNQDSVHRLFPFKSPPWVQASKTSNSLPLPHGNAPKTNTLLSDVHHVSSPAVITLPSAPSPPIKLVFHVNDAKSSKEKSANSPLPGMGVTPPYQSKPVVKNNENKMNDEDCHDDTLQCHLWADHGHCRGIAYAEFMKRHCKATCGYCSLPSVIKQGVKQRQPTGLSHDEPCEDAVSYEFSCPRWRAQGYCEKRQKEMSIVCRKTCGFCVSKKTRPRLPTLLQLAASSTAPETTNDQSTTDVKAPTPFKTQNLLPTKPTLLSILKNTTRVSASPGVQTMNLSPLKPSGNTVLQNLNKFTTSSLLTPFKASPPKQSGNSNLLNATEAPRVSAIMPLNFPPIKIKTAKQLKLKNLADALRPSVLKPVSASIPKQNDILNKQNVSGEKNNNSLNVSSDAVQKPGATAKLGNETKLPNQLGRNMSDALPQKQLKGAVTNSLKAQQGAATNSLQDKQGAVTNYLQDKQGAVTNSLQDKQGAATNYLQDKQGAVTNSLQDKQGVVTNSLQNKQGAATNYLQDKLGAVNNSLQATQGAVTNSLKAQQGAVTNSLKAQQGAVTNSFKAPLRLKFKSLGASVPHVVFSLNKKAPDRKFVSVDEDKVIQEGLTALQQRLQVPLEISAVAKSKEACRERLCKEKVKTQQAKTRGTIGNDVPDKPVSTDGCDDSCQRECLEAHNRYRINHGAPPLTLDQTLSNQAQQWANKKVFKHSPWAGGQGGETIALGSLYPSFTAAVKAWHDEEKDYDWSTGTGKRDMKISHFTQVVWKRAKFLGCGKTQVNGEPYYIAQMDIPGVIAADPGYERSNVGEPKKPDMMWFMNSSPYWKEMQLKDSIPKNIDHYIL